MKHSKIIAVLIGTVFIAGLAQAQELTGTLKKIKDTGTLTLGVRDSSIPFSYVDDKQLYQGYSIDLCLHIASALQKQLGLGAPLNIKMNSVTTATQIPLIANGTIDIACGSSTNNFERQKLVSFTPTIFITAGRLLAKKSSNIKSLDDMRGKTIVSTSGTTNLKQITALNAERNLGMNILTAKDHAEGFLLVETGRAVAFLMDDIILASLAASSKSPSDYSLTSDALSVEPYGLIVRRDDPQFKKAVDSALISVFKSGDINRIYAKWFQSPIPPKGISLNVPISSQLAAAFARPTDSGNPADYK